MTIDERQRFNLYERARDVLGQPEADTMMALLPPVGWADVATKQDLNALSEVLHAEIHAEIGGLRGEIHNVARQTLLVTMLGNSMLAAVIFGIARL